MNFTRDYLKWLLVPPIFTSIPPAVLFLWQVVQLSGTSAAIMGALTVVSYALGSVIFAASIRPQTEAVDAALTGEGDLSEAMSACLEKTKILSVLLWFAGGALYAITATMLLMPTRLGFAYFLTAALISAFISTVWGYVVGKHRLLRAAGDRPVVYRGAGLTLGRKIALVFIGSLTIAFAVLILLVSSRVSRTLEQMAIDTAGERFERLMQSAQAMASVDATALDNLRMYVPAGYGLHLIDAKGKVTSTRDSLESAEIEAMRKIRNGDSSAFISANVSRFGELKNGSILAMSVPWTAYQNVPMEIAFYTIVVAMLTMLLFGAATLILSRDITRPLHRLRAFAGEMAGGNFDVAPHVFSDDEVGQLADSFGGTRANLRRLLGRVGGSGTTITEGVRVIRGGTEMLVNRSREQSQLTQSSSNSVENVRGGIGSILEAADAVSTLTHDASARSLELQASSEEVARSMDYLFQSVEKTSASTTEMDASMREMSQRTEVLSDIGEEVLSFVSEMDATVAELLESSHSTAELAERVREDARAGGAAVNRTVEGINATHELTRSTADTMDELQRSVGQITQILSVIEEVANRTNLLSLNAAIIAAQAGEHGAGFTVVADEIRELAERTRGSTKEIASIVKAVQTGSRHAVQKMQEGVTRVGENVDLAKEAAASLDKIVGSATRSFDMATKITRSLSEQSTASQRLHEVASRMSDHIAEINRATREQARGTQLLAQESERVRDIAAQVKNATEEQSSAGKGITRALERIADDARAMRDLLEQQLAETDQIADASRVMLDIAQKNDEIAREFTTTVQNLVRSGQEFETEVSRFRFSGGDA
jgi:methyl-accepting chemotaxis protein